ncbi:MAG: hypothetical protein ACLPH3_08045 [Terracidiphilus sp.]
MEFATFIDPIQSIVERLENEPSFMEPSRLRERLEALDRLDACFPDVPRPIAAGDTELHRRASAVRARLEAANSELYATIRSEIRRGAGSEALRRWVDFSPKIDENGLDRGIGYDSLDELIRGVLPFEEPSDAPAPAEPEMVFYQPTPARHIFTLIGLTQLTAADVLVDLGSGLGHVPLLVSICTRARSVGIELEATYVERARQCAESLHLDRVAFINQDAREADLSEGTVFYLYTPFSGSILRCVLDRLRREAANRRIRICTYGPCTSVVAEERWLKTAAAPETDRIAVFSSRD